MSKKNFTESLENAASIFFSETEASNTEVVNTEVPNIENSSIKNLITTIKKNTENKSVKKVISLEPSLYHLSDKIAGFERVSLNEIVRRALKEYIMKPDRIEMLKEMEKLNNKFNQI